jgi:hypothetical protein
MSGLNWPDETARPRAADHPRFIHAGSNVCLDFHGDPSRAKVVVFSDGNHHMALQETLRAFVTKCPEVEDVFYTTTPPRVALQMLRSGCLDIGNLRLTVAPHVFISPPSILDQLVAEGRMDSHLPFMRGRGVVLLVRKGNPKRITGPRDLLRGDVKLFLSNPVTEKVSYQVYVDCLRRAAAREGAALGFLDHGPEQPDPLKLVYGELIHHREAPQVLADDQADAAPVYYHLALRYQRAFPELFEFVPLSTTEEDCAHGGFNCGLVGDGGAWGGTLLEFLMTDEVMTLYAAHGLARSGR